MERQDEGDHCVFDPGSGLHVCFWGAGAVPGATSGVVFHETVSWSNDEKSPKGRLFTLSKSRNGGNGASTAFATKERSCVHVSL